MTTTDRSRRRVRWTAISGTALMGVGAAVAIGANPFPHSDRPKDADVVALETREKALATEATRVNALNAERWASYRVKLAERKKEIAAVEAANAQALAASAAATSASYGGYASGGSSGSSTSGSGGYASAPAATYVPSAPVASSGSS